MRNSTVRKVGKSNARSKNQLEEINERNFQSYQSSIIEAGSNGNVSIANSFLTNNRGHNLRSKTFNEQMNTRRANSKQSIKSLREHNTSK